MNRESFFHKIIYRLSLRRLIIIPIFIILVIGSVLSYLQINSFARRYSEEVIEMNQTGIRNHVYDHLDSYFQVPEIVNINNAILAADGHLNLNDPLKLGRIFIKQVSEIPSVAFAYYANMEGGIVSSGIHEDQKRISYTENMTQGDFRVYEFLEDRNQLKWLKDIKDFDPRLRSWYIHSSVDEIYWTEVYLGAQENVLGISTSYPLISSEGKTLGVFGADILLDELSDFIMTMKKTEHSVVCLIDEEGFIVASSSGEKPFIEKEGQQRRLSAEDSSHAVIKKGYEALMSTGETQMAIDIEKKVYYYSMTQYSYNDHLNMYLMIAVPREDFVSGLEWTLLRFTLIFFGMIVLIFIVYIFITRWILSPITSLNSQVKAITDDKWGVQIETQRKDELGELTESFNTMSFKLGNYIQMFTDKQNELEKINISLEEMVQSRTKELKLLSITDDLTKIYNKRFLIDTLNHYIEMYDKEKRMFSIVILDIDHFKRINDTFGHIEGDRTLSDVSNFLSSKIRTSDVLGRYGGEEFLIIMADTLLKDAYDVAEDIRISLSSTQVGSKNNLITISGGVAEYIEGESIEDIIRRADKNLYLAKENGRNKVMN